MGHGKKNANRGEAINRNAARIGKLAEKVGAAEAKLKDGGPVDKKLKKLTKAIAGLGKAMERTVAQAREADKAMRELQQVVDFNAQPFWKRWWQTWKKDNELLKDANKPPVIDLPEQVLTSPVKLSDQQIAELEKEFLEGTSPIKNPTGIINYKKEAPSEGTEEDRRPAEVDERSHPTGEGEGGLGKTSEGKEEAEGES